MYQAAADRYNQVPVRHAGNSGLMLPVVSLGLWQHYSSSDPLADRRDVILSAFDHGIFHFDVANHYGGTDFGSSEQLLGEVLKSELKAYRDELVISTKVGYEIHPGPYGDGTSRKSIIQGLEGSLRRLNLDYVDLYYAHRFDETVDLEETVLALDQVVKQGKALYIGISNFDTAQTQAAIDLFKDLKTPFVVNQSSYNMFNRDVETTGLLDSLKADGDGLIAYGPLSEGLLSDRYLNGIPDTFKIHPTNTGTLAQGPDVVVQKLNQLNEIAKKRNQSLAQMALAWLLRDPVVTSVIIGTTSVDHLVDNLDAVANLSFSDDELSAIEKILA
ncbi:aldo/keto reductase [Lacticaseibacillus brantae]|uniref:Aldo keto reductase n=1 Tax=Lacticaseibacillus brantae DSM 23927 TaxID=1423727 RepID=A0A0R2AWR7_9LACO|nr:aldo/keto reductase [Lacticaseibacillus brantae]KRM71327.1 Aldo keto reductase [Lacticaseibacillus brantae DSM 23927]